MLAQLRQAEEDYPIPGVYEVTASGDDGLVIPDNGAHQYAPGKFYVFQGFASQRRFFADVELMTSWSSPRIITDSMRPLRTSLRMAPAVKNLGRIAASMFRVSTNGRNRGG